MIWFWTYLALILPHAWYAFYVEFKKAPDDILLQFLVAVTVGIFWPVVTLYNIIAIPPLVFYLIRDRKGK